MTLEAALRDFLASAPAIAAIADDRIHPVRLRIPVKQEQSAVTPTMQASLVFSLTARRVDPDQDDIGSVLISTYGVEAWCTDYDQTVQLSDATRRRLFELFGGQLLGEDLTRDEPGVQVQQIEFLSEQDEYDAERGIFVRTADYVITHEDHGNA